jgi:hypothetical protein
MIFIQRSKNPFVEISQSYASTLWNKLAWTFNSSTTFFNNRRSGRGWANRSLSKVSILLDRWIPDVSGSFALRVPPEVTWSHGQLYDLPRKSQSSQSIAILKSFKNSHYFQDKPKISKIINHFNRFHKVCMSSKALHSLVKILTWNFISKLKFSFFFQIPSHVNPISATYIEPFACSLHGVELANIQVFDNFFFCIWTIVYEN